MARGKSAAKVDLRSPLQRVIDNEATAEKQGHIDIITPEQKAKGLYHEDGRRVVALHDPVDRWQDNGRLEQRHVVVIDMLRRLWHLAGVPMASTTANYGERTPSTACYELAALNKLEAKEDLERIEGYFPGPLNGYYAVFENVCRWQMAAGDAGQALGYGPRSAQDRAHQIVVFVADIIATRERV